MEGWAEQLEKERDKRKSPVWPRMEDLRRAYLRLCKEAGVEPQESVVAQLQEARGAQSSRLDLSGQSLSADTCSVLARLFHKDAVFTEVSLSDCMLSEEGVCVCVC